MLKSALALGLALWPTLAFALLANGDSALLGTWKSACTPLPKRHAIVTTLRFTETDLQSDVELYAEADCRTLNLRVEMISTYSTGRSFGEGFEFDETPHHVMLVLLRPELAEYYNRTDGCGLRDWVRRIPRDVSGRTCALSKMPNRGVNVFDLYRVDGDQLRFGEFPRSYSMIREDLRPTRLGNFQVFTRLKN
jgi:hypothetical protein